MTILQQPDALSYSGNLKDFVIDTKDNVTFNLKLDGRIIIQEVYSPSNDRVRIPLKEIVDSLLSINLPDFENDVFIQDAGVKTFSLVLNSAEAILIKVVKGGFDNAVEDTTLFMKSQWLTYQPQQKKMSSFQPEILSYYAVGDCVVKVKGYFQDKTTEVKNFASLSGGNLYSLNMAFANINSKFTNQVGYYDVWVEDKTGSRLSYVQRFILSSYDNAEIYVFENTLGGFDVVVFDGQLTEGIKTAGIITAVNDISGDSDIDFSVVLEQDTGFIPSFEYARWLRGFFLSRQKYHVASSFRKIYIEESDNKFELKGVNSYTFEFRYSKQTQYDYVVRNQELLPELLVFPQTEELFFLAPKLSDFPLAPVAGDLLLPTQHLFGDKWQRLSVASIVETTIDACRAYLEGAAGTNIGRHFYEKDGQLFCKLDLIGEKEISAHGEGPSGSGGGFDEASLEVYLKANRYTTESWVTSQGYLKAISKGMIENVLTGNVTTHIHNQYLTVHQSLAGYATETWVSANFTKYVHPSGAGFNHIPAGGVTGQILRWSASGTAVWGTDNDTTYSEATATIPGLMTAAMVLKLNGIATNANNYVHPTGAGNNHIPTAGSTGQWLKWSAAGMAVWFSPASLTIFGNTYNPNTALTIASIAASRVTGIASKAAVFDTSGVLSSSATTLAEIGYLSGVTSSLQTQLNSKLATETWNTYFELKDGKLYCNVDFIGKGGVSAYGEGPSGAGDGGIDELQLESYLTTNKYTTQTWVTSQKYLQSISLHTHVIADIIGLQSALNSKEATFTKNPAFNKNFGTVAGTVAQGNDNRIANGQTAYNWGNHASAGYLPLTAGSGGIISGMLYANNSIRLGASSTGCKGGILFWSPSWKAWQIYMASAGSTIGANGIKAPVGFYVSSYALRSAIENNSGYGWTWESGSSTGDPIIKMELRSSDGYLHTTGNMESDALVIGKTGIQIGSTADYGFYISSSRLTAGLGTAKGFNVGSLLVSSAWADYTNVPSFGVWAKGVIQSAAYVIAPYFRTLNTSWAGSKVPNDYVANSLYLEDAYSMASEGPSSYANILTISGRVNHWVNQMWFGSNAKIYTRMGNYMADPTKREFSAWTILATEDWVTSQITLGTAKYLPLAGGTMAGGITMNTCWIYASGGNGLLCWDGSYSFVGVQLGTTLIRSGATDLIHRKNGIDYKIWDISNLANPASQAALNNFVHSGNEITLANGYAGGDLWINYRGATAAIVNYRLGNGIAGVANLYANNLYSAGNLVATQTWVTSNTKWTCGFKAIGTTGTGGDPNTAFINAEGGGFLSYYGSSGSILTNWPEPSGTYGGLYQLGTSYAPSTASLNTQLCFTINHSATATTTRYMWFRTAGSASYGGWDTTAWKRVLTDDEVMTGTGQANKLIKTDANGYANFGWINTISGTASGTITRVYCSQDGYIRYLSPVNLTSSLGLATTAWVSANFNNYTHPTGSGNNHIPTAGSVGQWLKWYSAGVAAWITPSALTRGNYLTGNNYDGNAATTWAVDATSVNTANKVVARDASGNFSAGTITAALSGNASSATQLATARTIWGQSFNGSANVAGAITGATSGSFSGRVTAAGLTVGYNNTSYVLSTTSFICNSWVRTTGSAGWYSETYSGGIYMTDATWVRVYNSKQFCVSSTAVNSISTDGGFVRETYGGASWNMGHGALGVAITDNSAQTPLLVAYRSGQVANITGINRLFAIELLNTGAILQLAFGGTAKFILTSAGNFSATGEITAYSASDSRLKNNVKPLDGLVILRKLRFKEFDWNNDARKLAGDNRSRGYGLIAQDVKFVLPDIVNNVYNSKYLGIDYGKLIPFIGSAVLQHDDEITRLKSKVRELEQEVKRLSNIA